MAQSSATGFWSRMAGSLGKRANDNATSSVENNGPTIGDRYAQTTNGAPVWIVENVVKVSSSRYPLVRLTSEKYPDLMKIVSLSALADVEEFTRAH